MKRIIISCLVALFLLSAVGTVCLAAGGNKPKKPYYKGQAIEGATLQLLTETGEIVKEWVTTEDAYTINAELEPGCTYILHEKTAPEGYLPAEDIRFTVSEDGSLDEVVMEDAPTVVKIEKKDKETSEYVYNAVLQVLDDYKQVVDEWTTDGTAHELKGILKAGGTYTIHEKTVPIGYEKSGDQTFTVPITEEPLNVTFFNVKQKDDSPKTGDMNHAILYISIAGGMLLLIGILLIMRRREE